MKEYYIRFKNIRQLETVLDLICSENISCNFLADCEGVSADAVSEMISSAEKNAGFSADPGCVYFCLPEIARQKMVHSIERMILEIPEGSGLLIRNPDQLEMILETGFTGPLIADPGLYAYNTQSIRIYRELFPAISFIAPDELTDRELLQINTDYIYKAYGHQLLMVSNQCLMKNCYGCSKEAFPVWFKNERGDRFSALNRCSQCYSCIYDGRIISMLDRLEEVPYKRILIDFTLENDSQITDVMKQICGQHIQETGYIRGHHYKAIE